MQTREKRAEHYALRNRLLRALDALGLVLIEEPVQGKCNTHFRKYDYLPDEQIVIYGREGVIRGAEWSDDYCYYHIFSEGTYKLFRTIEDACAWAEQHARSEAA